MVNSADDSCQKFEDKIINWMTPDYDDLLSLQNAAKEGHENARWLLGSLGIHQDGDSYKLTRVDEVWRMIIEKRYNALNIHLVHVEGDHPAEDGDQSVELGGLCGQGNHMLTCDENQNGSDEMLNFQLNDTSSKKPSKIQEKFKNFLSSLKVKKEGRN